VAIATSQSDAYDVMSLVCAYKEGMTLALLHVDRALALKPNDIRAAANRAQWLAFSGRYAEALVELEIFIKRDPFPLLGTGMRRVPLFSSFAGMSSP
jgi:hypothetical protein